MRVKLGSLNTNSANWTITPGYLICRDIYKNTLFIYTFVELADLQFKVSSGWFIFESSDGAVLVVLVVNCRALRSWQLKPLTLTPSAGLCTTVVCGS